MGQIKSCEGCQQQGCEDLAEGFTDAPGFETVPSESRRPASEEVMLTSFPRKANDKEMRTQFRPSREVLKAVRVKDDRQVAVDRWLQVKADWQARLEENMAHSKCPKSTKPECKAEEAPPGVSLSALATMRSGAALRKEEPRGTKFGGSWQRVGSDVDAGSLRAALETSGVRGRIRAALDEALTSHSVHVAISEVQLSRRMETAEEKQPMIAQVKLVNPDGPLSSPVKLADADGSKPVFKEHSSEDRLQALAAIKRELDKEGAFGCKPVQAERI